MTLLTDKKAHCHVLVKDTARSLAEALYEKMASESPGFYKANPEALPFINSNWKHFLEEARSTLVQMLTLPYPEELKEQIAEAIIQDSSLTRDRPARLASRIRTGQLKPQQRPKLELH